MTIVITTHGSTGDIYPLIRLSLALIEAGHQVRFATSMAYRQEVEDAGVPFYDIPPAWDKKELQYWMGRLQKLKSPVAQLKELYRAAAPHLEDTIDAMEEILADADCLISSYLFPINKAIATKRGVPYISYAFAHNTVPSRYYPPHGFPRLRGWPNWIQLRWNRFCWKMGNVVVDTTINATISRALKKKGLAPVKDFFSKSAALVLVAVSPGLMRPKTKLNPRFQFSGYCRWQAPVNPELEQRIHHFTQGQAVPILTYGSMVYDDPEAFMRRLLENWPADKKLILQPGWSGFKVPAAARNILEVGPLSHDQLFAHASVVIHHGGAGTTASVLHAGKPHIVVPHIGDQNFFAAEVIRLGAGIKLRKTRWPESLFEKVELMENTPSFSKTALQLQSTLLQENGPAASVRLIEAFLASGRQPMAETSRCGDEF